MNAQRAIQAKASVQSTYVCSRCGLSVYSWSKGAGLTWKHAAGWHTGKSCGESPAVVRRIDAVAKVRLPATWP